MYSKIFEHEFKINTFIIFINLRQILLEVFLNMLDVLWLLLITSNFRSTRRESLQSCNSRNSDFHSFHDIKKSV